MESRDGKLRQQRRNVPENKNKPSQDYVSNCTPSKFNVCATFAVNMWATRRASCAEAAN